MSLHDELGKAINERSASPAKRRSRVPYPQGWEPRVTTSEKDGEAVSDVVEADADEEALLLGWLLDPEIWQIQDDTLVANRWMMNGEWQYQYKAKLKKRVGKKADVEELLKIVSKYKAPKAPLPTGDHAYVVNLSDWQIGKGEGGGTEATVAKILASFDAAELRLKNLRKSGIPIGQIYVVGMGDLLERCANNYADQTFTTDLNEREQMRVIRRLLLDIVKRMAKQAERVVITSVGGNHGENRNGSGKAFTGDGDNMDVALFETVYEALGENTEAFGHVSFYLPDDQLCVALDICGTVVAFTHGHLGKKGANPMAKAMNWWMGNAFGNNCAVDAEVLVTAHYHHFAACNQYGRLWLQCPAQDGGSKWYQDSTGSHASTGMLTFVVGPDGAKEIQVV